MSAEGTQMEFPAMAGGEAEPRGAVQLTGEQQEAVARRAEPLLLSAAAGSGKTSVLVERFVAAVLEDGVSPGRILAITFTERAAGELRERVRARLLGLGEREAARDTEAAFVSTFHGFCARLLRTHALQAGLDPGFTILDEGLAGRLRELAFSAALGELLAGGRGAALDLVAAYGPDRLQEMIAGAHAELRSRGQRLPRLPVPAPAAEPDELHAAAVAACALLDELLVGFGRTYEAFKRRRGAVDFDDLELCAGELLRERESVRSAWSERFELLMVDEFQDTNPRQLAILHALDRGNLFTVGDEHQAIYGFRHADVALFRARRSELAARGASLALRANFRGRPQLLDAVNAVFAERLGADFAPLVAGREAAGQGERAAGEEPPVELLVTARSGWELDEGLAAEIARGLPAAPIWRQAEARLLAERVAGLVEGGRARAGEVAVLLRALGDVEVYERALQLRGLRTLAMVGGFWGRLQTRDLLAYLRALANPLDEQALYETLASPLVGLSSDGLALLASAARLGGRGVWAAAAAIGCHAPLEPAGGEGEPAVPGRPGEAAQLCAGDVRALERFCGHFGEERGRISQRSISRLIEGVIDACGYREHVLALEWGERRLANIHKLLRLARRFEASEGRDLRAFLEHVERLGESAGASEPDAPVDSVEPDAVRLMTIHAAKGLEFPVVCVADLGRQPNTRVPRLLVEGERIGLQLQRLDGEEAAPCLDYEDLSEERRRAQAEEEDRIVYVAMTRARERLLLSGAVEFARWPSPGPAAATISWLAPALAPALPAALAGPLQPLLDLPLAGVADAGNVRCVLGAPATLGPLLARGPGAGGRRVAEGAPEGPPPGAREPAAPPPQTPPGAAGGRGQSAPEPPLPETFSYTSLSALERCGYRYYLERVLGLPEDRAAAGAAGEGAARDGLEARARGTLMHRLLESLDFARPRAPTAEEVDGIARELGLRVGARERDELAALVAAAGRAGPAARVAGAHSVHREHPFAFSLEDGGALITGVIDLLAREAEGRWMVLDYKSDRVDPTTDLAALVAREYAIQRELYALAVLRAGAAEVEIVHWFLQRPEEPVAARFAASRRGELEGLLAARLGQVGERRYGVSDAPHRGLCLTCPGRASLCSWGEERTLREDPGPGAGERAPEAPAGPAPGAF